MNNSSFFPQFDRNIQIGKQLLHLNYSLKSLSSGLRGIDFTKMNFTPPLLAVHYASLIHEFPQLLISGVNNSYLETIKFPTCLTFKNGEDLEPILGPYLDKSYLPIIKFSTNSTGKFPEAREALLSHVFGAIRRIASLPTNYFTAISYLLSELTDNMVEHASHAYGFLAFQYFKESGFIAICLADRGIGLLGSYKNYQGDKDFSYVQNHLAAVDAAVKGSSTKNLSEERGFGIATSRRILTKGLSGSFVYLTGNALLINDELSNFGVESKGAIILVRIPVRDLKKGFDWFEFVE